MRIARQRSLEINPNFDSIATSSIAGASPILGYITHDVTKEGHPMPFLISSVFRHHTLPVIIYSIKQGEDSNAITQHNNYTEIPPSTSPASIAQAIRNDNVTHLIDHALYVGSRMKSYFEKTLVAISFIVCT